MEAWRISFCLLDLLGVVVFGQLFLIMVPHTRWRAGDKYLLATALIKAALTVFFLWLLITDLAALFDWDLFGLWWVAWFPTRGLMLRAILIVPGVALLLKLVK